MQIKIFLIVLFSSTLMLATPLPQMPPFTANRSNFGFNTNTINSSGSGTNNGNNVGNLDVVGTGVNGGGGGVGQTNSGVTNNNSSNGSSGNGASLGGGFAATTEILVCCTCLGGVYKVEECHVLKLLPVS